MRGQSTPRQAHLLGLKPVALVAGLLLAGCGGGQVSDRMPFDDAVDPDEPDRWADVQATDGEEATGRDALSCKLSSGFAEPTKTRLTYAEVAELAKSAGVSCGYNLVKAVAIAAAESSRYTHAYLRNTNCSTDRGLWQINSKYWGSYSSFDLQTNAEGMFVISAKGTKWTPWVTYNKGIWKTYRNSACSAVQDLCGTWYC